MSDHDDTVVVKPCTQAEIDFYQSANSLYPKLAYFMPDFLGTLEVNQDADRAQTAGPTTSSDMHPRPTLPDSAASGNRLQAQPSSASKHGSRPPTPEPLRLRGKPIDTNTCVVLSAVTSGFKRPNILDLKLGSRLWGDEAPLAKRAKLDKVSQETTSSSLGFRIAGMRVWAGQSTLPGTDQAIASRKPDVDLSTMSAGEESTTRQGHVDYEEDTKYLGYNKLFGRAVVTDRIVEAFKQYFIVPTAGIGPQHARELIRHFRREIKEIHDVLSSMETRMYSSSILLVYEGDPKAYEEALEYQSNRRASAGSGSLEDSTDGAPGAGMPKAPQEVDFDSNAQRFVLNGPEAYAPDDDNEVEDEEGDEEEEEERRIYALKLIDFAHASWTPGKGPDENVLQGIRSLVAVLVDLEKQLRDDG